MKIFPLLQRTVLLAAFCLFNQVASASSEESTVRLFDITQNSQFSNFRKPLIAYLKSRNARRNTSICLLGEQYADETRSAWVMWKSGKVLLLWSGGESSMIGSRRIIDLNRDVVSTESDVNGSTYLVTRAWVKALETKCAAFGTNVVVTADDLRRENNANRK